jgi:hypothetical protein
VPNGGALLWGNKGCRALDNQRRDIKPILWCVRTAKEISGLGELHLRGAAYVTGRADNHNSLQHGVTLSSRFDRLFSLS